MYQQVKYGTGWPENIALKWMFTTAFNNWCQQGAYEDQLHMLV